MTDRVNIKKTITKKNILMKKKETHFSTFTLSNHCYSPISDLSQVTCLGTALKCGAMAGASLGLVSQGSPTFIPRSEKFSKICLKIKFSKMRFHNFCKILCTCNTK